LHELVDDVDPSLVATIERAMDADTSVRFGSAAEMAGALGAGPSAVLEPVASEEVRPHGRDATRKLELDPTTLELGRPAPLPPSPLVPSGFLRRVVVTRLRSRAAALVATVLVAGALVGALVAGATRATPPEPPVTVTEPALTPLEEALRDLQEAVRP
jgi:hypothetical protein